MTTTSQFSPAPKTPISSIDTKEEQPRQPDSLPIISDATPAFSASEVQTDKPSFPPTGNEYLTSLVKKASIKKKKGKKKRKKVATWKAGRAGSVLTQEPCTLSPIDTESQSHVAIGPHVGGEGVAAVPAMEVGFDSPTDKNVDQKGIGGDDEPTDDSVLVVDGDEDTKQADIQTRAQAWAKQKAEWEAKGDVMVRVYARPLNPLLVLVEMEDEKGEVARHGRIVVTPKHREMFGPGKLIWVRGPLVGDKWVLAGKYNFTGHRVL
jgi:hypothetical protein